ncbi:membrane protein [Tenuifilaceae bacterium CYCD]|nr:membrane protein [Tenuifilaceae bacterium CYCD]
MIRLFKYVKGAFRETGTLWLFELKRIFGDGGVMLLFFGATIIYPLLYSISYNPELLRETRIAVVDLDNSKTSRELVRKIDATEQVLVYLTPTSLAEATDEFNRGEVNGIVVIPEDFSKNTLTGAQAYVALYADASYMLIYKQALQGVVSASMALGTELKINRYVMQGVNPEMAKNYATPVEFISEPLYNPVSGYGTYAMPPLILLIIQQSLLMGIGMLAGSARERGAESYLGILAKLKGSAVRLIIGKVLAYLTVYIPVVIYLLLLVIRGFNFPHYGNVLVILGFLLPFLLASMLLGMLLSTMFKSREQSLITLLFTSVPLLFLSGFSWPEEALPKGLNFLAQVFPVVPAIKGFIKINSMGTAFDAAISNWLHLWILVVIFFFANWIILHRTYLRHKDDIEQIRIDL